MKIATIIGARPQFIKAAAVSKKLRQHADEFFVHTGQHYDQNMSHVFFDEMEIPAPKYHLGIGGLSHGAMTGRLLEKVETVLQEEKPDLTLVYGDTNSTLAGALAAAKLHIPVAHVEAGMRSFNKKMPEEINRILTDQCSSLLFTPTPTATKNLLKEGYDKEAVLEVGDVMFDATCFYQNKLTGSFLNQFHLEPKSYLLVTLHRAENTDDPARLREIVQALEVIASRYSLVWPLHPRTKKKLESTDWWGGMKTAFHLVDPLGYLEMLEAEKNALLIITDSGGVQKEAFFSKVPCVTLRNETEWVELVDLGVNVLVPAHLQSIVDQVEALIKKEIDWNHHNLYGEGKASEKIVEALQSALERRLQKGAPCH